MHILISFIYIAPIYKEVSVRLSYNMCVMLFIFRVFVNIYTRYIFLYARFSCVCASLHTSLRTFICDFRPFPTSLLSLAFSLYNLSWMSHNILFFFNLHFIRLPFLPFSPAHIMTFTSRPIADLPKSLIQSVSTD